jgi:UDP-glucose 4-epimerase
MSNIVITGAAGFIGSHIATLAHQRSMNITLIDNLSTGTLDNLSDLLDQERVRFIKADITQREEIEGAFCDADHVFHLAARISVPESMEYPERYITTNTLGTLNVLNCCKIHKIKSIVHSSTAAIYGDNPISPKEETLPPEPLSPYAISKLDGEYLLKMYQQQYGIHAVSLRYFNVFGPKQRPDSAYAAAVPIFIDRAINNKDIIIYGDGSQTRDFIFVGDVAKANLQASTKGSGVINAACGRAISINDLAHMLIKITDSKSKVIYQPERNGDIKHSCANNHKMRDLLKCSPNEDMTQGLLQTIEYFQSMKACL